LTLTTYHANHDIVHFILMFVVALTSGSLMAQVDQANPPHPFPGGVNVRFDPRQEFTPNLEALDSVLLSFSTGAVPRQGGTLIVAIRQGGVDGSLIGTSDSVSLPGLFGGHVIFRFPERVALVPGNTYALQPISVAGSVDWILDTNPGYPGGRLFYNGSFINTDLVFMEGIAIPEPSTVTLLVVAASIFLAAFHRRDARRRVSRKEGT
jgi:hypothetical protein